MQAEHSVSIDDGISADGSACFFVKLQSSGCELNVAASADELEDLSAVASARWLDRKSLRVGQCLGAPVFWSCEDGHLSVLVGSDDETWEVSFAAPESLVAALLEEIERVRVK
jgi:hypothetical protein